MTENEKLEAGYIGRCMAYVEVFETIALVDPNTFAGRLAKAMLEGIPDEERHTLS
jgi:hypothetical protein